MNNLQAIKQLRALTGAGIMACQQALQESNNNEEKALQWLKKRGLDQAAKKALREAKEGCVASYLHGRGRIGVLVEVNVETDFAASGDDFKTFVHQLCLHITAMNPLFIHTKDISEERKQKELEIFKEQAKRQGRPNHLLVKIATGKLDKWLSEICLMNQIFLSTSQSDKPQTVQEVLTSLIARLGENVVIRRFIRFELGEKESFIACHSHLPSQEKN